MTIDISKIQVAEAFRHLDPNQGLADGITAGFPSIRYRGKQWTLSYGGKNYPFRRDDDGSPLTYIDTVILGISPGLSKSYFGPGAWTEESASGPICYSTKGDVPEPDVPVRQSQTCGICPHNDWITKPDGGRGKECQDHKRMAVLLMPAMTKKMLGSPLLEPIHLKIPPGSLRSLKKYSDALQTQGIPFSAVVTRVSFSPDRIFEMTFDVSQVLTNAEAPRVLPLKDSPQTRAIMGSMPEVKEIAPPAPAPERVETGLVEAFDSIEGNGGAQARPYAGAPEATSQPAKPARTRGRPKAVQTVEHEAEPAAPKETKTGTAAESTQTEAPWEESDTDIDATVVKLMGDKMNKMMK